LRCPTRGQLSPGFRSRPPNRLNHESNLESPLRWIAAWATRLNPTDVDVAIASSAAVFNDVKHFNAPAQRLRKIRAPNGITLNLLKNPTELSACAPRQDVHHATGKKVPRTCPSNTAKDICRVGCLSATPPCLRAAAMDTACIVVVCLPGRDFVRAVDASESVIIC